MKRGWWAVLVLLVLAQGAIADNWPNWRGPSFNGVSPSASAPLKWSESENIQWKVDLPGPGGSTPAVWEDRIFVTSGDDGKNAVLCFDRSGNELWRTHVGQEVAGKHRKGSGANPSPVTDGKHVYVYYKSGDTACLDFEGQVVWQRNLQQQFGEDTLWWDLGSSPVLVDNLLIVTCIQSKPSPSYLVALDKLTGDEIWKHDRNVEAPDESQQTYATPVVVAHGAKSILVVLGADHVTAHDAATGEELWRVGGLNPGQERFFRSIASPVVADGIVVAPYARGKTLTAIKMGGKGDVTDTHVLWTNEEISGREPMSADVPTPAAADGRVYVCADRGQLLCLDLKTGDVIWNGELERSRSGYSASPVLADGKIYLVREDGTCFVLEQGDTFKILAKNTIDAFVVATPVIVDGKLLLRTEHSLYCIGE